MSDARDKLIEELETNAAWMRRAGWTLRSSPDGRFPWLMEQAARILRTQETEMDKWRDHVGQWKLASGLEVGGDPDDVTPRMLQRETAKLEAERDKLRVELEDARADFQALGRDLANEIRVREQFQKELEEARNKLGQVLDDYRA